MLVLESIAKVKAEEAGFGSVEILNLIGNQSNCSLIDISKKVILMVVLVDEKIHIAASKNAKKVNLFNTLI
jgi:hypothetical protein